MLYWHKTEYPNFKLFYRNLRNMKKRFSLLFIALLLVGFLSAEKYYISIDILRPGDLTFASQVNNLLLVNNTVPQPHGFGHSITIEGQNNLVEQNTDSLPLFCLAAMQEDLQNIGFFSSVQLHATSTNSKGSFYALQRLSPQWVDSLCIAYGADALLALNRIAVTDQITCLFSEYAEEWSAALDVSSLSSWSLHYPHSSEVTNKHYADTLSWQTENFELQTAYAQLPDRADAEVDIALHTGAQSVKRILPAWQRTDRYFYTNNNKRLLQGMDSIPYQKWDAAFAIWNALHEDKSVVTRAYAAANVAVIYELKGHFEQAIQWVQKACELAHSSVAYQLKTTFLEEQQNYLQQLKQRIKDEELLKRQL